MNWNSAIIGGFTIGIAISLCFFVCALFFAMNRRTYRFGAPLAVLLAIGGILTIFINPTINITLSLRIDESRLKALRGECLNQPPERLLRRLGAPDTSTTNEYGVCHAWLNTSPFFSKFPQNTIAIVSNETVVGIWLDH
jgi:hypothetical protein